MEEKKKSIGGLWLRESKKGNKFMYGSIEIKGEKNTFVVFRNQHKQKDSHPDYVIFKQDEDYKKKESEGAPGKDQADVDEGSIPF